MTTPARTPGLARQRGQDDERDNQPRPQQRTVQLKYLSHLGREYHQQRYADEGHCSSGIGGEMLQLYQGQPWVKSKS